MISFHRAVLATALAGAGLAASTGAAVAGENPDNDHREHEKHVQNGVVNFDDTQTVVPINACNNDVPVNVAGVQVPIQDVAADVPLLSGSSDGGGNAAGVDKRCGHKVDTDN